MANREETSELLESAKDFWDNSPCDGQADATKRIQFRFSKEPWLQPIIEKVAADHNSILEIGCGQGTDALIFCRTMSPTGQYTALDYSPRSIKNAENAFMELAETVNVHPKFIVGNAESLPFADNSVEAVYSMGALHHTPNLSQAISEIQRTLRTGGKGYIILYRTWSLKLIVAHTLRGLQRVLDSVFGKKNTLLSLVSNVSAEKFVGTALKECFGVPILRSLTGLQMRELFKAFKINKLEAHGSGIPAVLGINASLEKASSILGYFWYIEIMKIEKP